MYCNVLPFTVIAALMAGPSQSDTETAFPPDPILHALYVDVKFIAFGFEWLIDMVVLKVLDVGMRVVSKYAGIGAM